MNKTSIQLLVIATAVVFVCGCTESDTVAPEPPDAHSNKDVTAPEKILDPLLTYPGPSGEAILSWLAPRDDAKSDRVAEYEIRYSYSFPLVWESSARVTNPPGPGVAGETQEYVFADPQRGYHLYAAILSRDEARNESPISNVAHVRIDGFDLVGTCKNAVTCERIAGVDVTVTGRRVYPLVSDAEGRFQVEDLTTGVINVTLRSGSSGKILHSYVNSFQLEGDASEEYLMIEYQPTEIPAGKNILNLFLTAVNPALSSGVYRKWRSYPIECYIEPFVNNGQDFEAISRQAAEEWSVKTGHQIFKIVDAPPDTGVTVIFKPRSQIGGHIGITHHTDDDDNFPLRSDVEIMEELATYDQVWITALHELGHTIRLWHLPDGYVMYAGRPLPMNITNDEIKVVQLLMALPNEIDLSVYVDP